MNSQLEECCTITPFFITKSFLLLSGSCFRHRVCLLQLGHNDGFEVKENARFSSRSIYSRGTSCLTSHSLHSFRKSTADSNKNTNIAMLEELAREWARGEKLEVYQKHLNKKGEGWYDHKLQRLARVTTIQKDLCAQEAIGTVANWDFKENGEGKTYFKYLKKKLREKVKVRLISNI